MIYGFRDPTTKQWRKWVRLSSSVSILGRDQLSMGDYVWMSDYSIIDAAGGVTIGEGCQFGAYVIILTHGSEHSIRLLGRSLVHIPNAERLGYTRGPVQIGEYTFFGAHCAVLPGTTVGTGCLIGAGTLVSGIIPDYSVVLGWPGRIVGDTRTIDRDWMTRHDFSATYYQPMDRPPLHPHESPADHAPVAAGNARARPSA